MDLNTFIASAEAIALSALLSGAGWEKCGKSGSSVTERLAPDEHEAEQAMFATTQRVNTPQRDDFHLGAYLRLGGVA
ncbi:hypothetical protein WI664_16500 [Vibrio cholerae]